MSELTFYTTDTPRLPLTLSDGAEDQYPRAYIYTPSGDLNETVDLSHIANGFYLGTTTESYSALPNGIYNIVYEVYQDSDRTNLNEDYDIVPDNMRIINYISGRFFNRRGRRARVDTDLIANKVWNHDKATKLIKSVGQIKKTTDKIKTWFDKVIDKIKNLVIPEPEIDLTSLESGIKKINKIDSGLKKVFDKLSVIQELKPRDYTDDFKSVQGLIKETEKITKNLYNYIKTLDDDNKRIQANNLVQLNQMADLINKLKQNSNTLQLNQIADSLNKLKKQLTK